jgi:alpha-methylacyl-CoA racemase
VYECSDGTYVSIGSLEPQFYALLRELLGLQGADWDDKDDRSSWPQRKEQLAAIFRTRTRQEWCDLLEGTDVCFAPVLSMTEAYEHPHNVARGTFVTIEGITQPAPAPRFSRTRPAVAGPPAQAGAHTDEVLAEAGFDATDIAKLREAGAVR